MKKIISIFALFTLLFNILFSGFTTVYANQLNNDLFLLGGFSTELKLNPNSFFKLETILSNNSGEDINNLEGIINFEHTSDIIYNGDLSNYITNEYTVPSSAFNSNGLRVFFGDSLFPVDSKAYFYFNPGIPGFKVSQNAKNYKNEVTTNFLGNGGGVSSNTLTRYLYVNVKPHIIDYYFEKGDGSSTTNQIQGSNAEAVNLVIKVRDYNTCSNIAGGNVTADLSQLGLSSTEVLTFQNCEGDGITGVFKKTGITTIAPKATYTFNHNNFSATDLDGNKNDPNDSRFNENKTTNLNLTVVAAEAPLVNFDNINNTHIGGPEKQFSTISFSSNQISEYRITLGDDGTCETGNILLDWTTYNDSNNIINYNVNSTDLEVGNNNLNICFKNNDDNTGSYSLNIIKDITTPIIGNISISPHSVIENNPTARFSCSENGEFALEVGGDGVFGNGTLVQGFTSTNANDLNNIIIDNNFLNLGVNNAYLYCKDLASNISNFSVEILKQEPTPSMVGKINDFSDCDVDYQGLDGRDLCLSWNNDFTSYFTGFESYRIYVLPSNINIDKNLHTPIKLLVDENLNFWNGTESIKKDSLGNNFEGSGSYKACIAIMGKSGILGDFGCSESTILTSDVVTNPTVENAEFIGDETLRINTNSTLSSDLNDHDFSKISYTFNGELFSGLEILSISDKSVNVRINSLGNTDSIGTNLTILEGALRADGGGFNFEQNIGNIADKQKPIISNFVLNTASTFNNFYKGTINVSYNTSENLKAGGSTKIEFSRVSGNSGNNVNYNITNSLKLSKGNQNIDIDLDSLGLTSGTRYKLRFISSDINGNLGDIVEIENFYYDLVGPNAPEINSINNTPLKNPTLTWNNAIDNNGNGSGVKTYELKVFSGNNCSGTALQTHTTNSNVLSKEIDELNNGTYSWNVTPTDNMLNVGETSICSSFIIDTNIPEIISVKVLDTETGSSLFTRLGRQVQVIVNVINSNIDNIYLNLSSLAPGSTYESVKCSEATGNITCSRSGDFYTFTFNVGFAGNILDGVKQLVLNTYNTNGFNNQSKIFSTTIDNTPPTVGVISGLTGTIGGLFKNVSWTGITDSNLDYLKFEYSNDGGVNYNLAGTGANISPFTWNLSGINSGNNYKFRITAIDKAGNQSFTESDIFSVDKDAPVILAGTITNPSSGSFIMGNSQVNINWISGNITDVGGLASNPITLEYSIDNGLNWQLIANSLENSGTYIWNTPNLNSNNQAKLRIKAIDNVGNESSYQETNYSFTIDSQKPTFSIGLGTPPNGSYINNSGFDLIGSFNDNISLDKIFYYFLNKDTGEYWDGNNYISGENWILLKDDISALGYNLNETLNPEITSGNKYELNVKVVDKSGNETIGVPREFLVDLSGPDLEIFNENNSFFNGNIVFSGSAIDNLSGVSSVKISIKKGSQYWNGTSWINEENQLSVNSLNNFSNWDYNFVSPIGDDDNQTYEVIVYAYDKSYKVNNSTSRTINITLDKSSPIIEDDVFTFSTSSPFIGGENLEITWDNSKIYDSISGLSSNPITIHYHDGNSWNLISENLLNNGTYNWILPTIDSNQVRVRITAVDNVGNTSTKSSNKFIIDSTPPEIISVNTRGDGFGKIGGLIVEFSEIIRNQSSLDINSIFSVSDSINLSNSYIQTVVDNKTILELSFLESFGDTSSRPTLFWNSGIVQDLAGKYLEGGSLLSNDNSGPRVIESSVFDNNLNGKLDTIEVVFSENILNNSSISSFVLNNNIFGITINSMNIVGNKAILNLDENSNFNTSIGNTTISFNSNENWRDSSNNIAHSRQNITILDKAKPFLVDGKILDTNNDFLANRIELTFSENIIGNTSNFSISDGNILSSSISGNKILLNIGGISSTDPNIFLDYDGIDINDISNNSLDTFSGFLLEEKISPKLLSSSTLDQNGNGKIDGVLLEFSENISGNFNDFDVLVDGYSVLNTNAYSFIESNKILVQLKEKSSYDSAETPEVNIYNNTSVVDLSGNLLLDGQDVVSNDKVGPVISGARHSGNKIFLYFSEEIDQTSFLAENFVFENISFGNITGLDFQELSLTFDNLNVTYGESLIGFKPNSVFDLFGNTQSQNYFTNISAPIIINEIMISNNENNNYIELRNLSDSQINLDGWTIGGITLNNAQINANGYYLISNSLDSNLSVTPDLISSIDLSGNELILTDGNIVIDRASLITLLGDFDLPASIERKNIPGNGLNSNNWYQAIVGVGFNNDFAKGTPGSQNIFDDEAPVLEVNIENNKILPLGFYNIIYNYTDNIEIDLDSSVFNLQKWDGSSWGDNFGYVEDFSTIDKTSISLENLNYGRYRSQFSISDTSGNTSTKNLVFYVDDFSFSIEETGTLDFGSLTVGELNLLDEYVILRVNTIGVGFNISHYYDEQNLSSWNGNTGFGACFSIGCDNLESLDNSVVISQEKNLNINGELRENIYYVRYGLLLNLDTPSGFYEFDNNYSITFDY